MQLLLVDLLLKYWRIGTISRRENAWRTSKFRDQTVSLIQDQLWINCNRGVSQTKENATYCTNYEHWSEQPDKTLPRQIVINNSLKLLAYYLLFVQNWNYLTLPLSIHTRYCKFLLRWLNLPTLYFLFPDGRNSVCIHCNWKKYWNMETSTELVKINFGHESE